MSIHFVFRNAAQEPFYQGILAVTEEELVSSDFIGNSHSAIVDTHLTAVVGGKVVRFKLSPALARAHRQNRGKVMTETEAVAFVETKRRARALRRARPYLASRP